jgi:transcriptional regulator with XRE-family HTH domain
MDSTEVPARIKAARMLRGMSQDELARKLVDAGLPWRVAGALERGEIELRSAHLAALVDSLGFPQRWFTAPLDELIPPEPPAGVLERLEEIIRLLHEG